MTIEIIFKNGYRIIYTDVLVEYFDISPSKNGDVKTMSLKRRNNDTEVLEDISITYDVTSISSIIKTTRQ